MEEKTRNHYVQKARLKHFSFRVDNSRKTYVIDLEKDNIDPYDISEVFELEFFYPPELEKRLGRMESKASEVLNRFLKDDKWILTRSDYNRILRYALIQTYRTPATVKEMKESLLSDPKEVVKKDLNDSGFEEDDEGI